MQADAAEAVTAVYRSDWSLIVATLIRLVGDFDVAEEAAQEAFTAAVDHWRVTGVPEFPRAWLIKTARSQGHRPPPPAGAIRSGARIAFAGRRALPAGALNTTPTRSRTIVFD